MPSRIKYDAALIKTMSFFTSKTHAKLKDCFFMQETIVFVVEEGHMAKAIGKGGETVRRLATALQKKVKIVEFVNSPENFLQNFLAPIKLKSAVLTDNVLTITTGNSHERGLIIGRAAANLRNLEKILQRYFSVKEIKVV